MRVIFGEIYASEGGLLKAQVPEIQPIIARYLHAVETAGAEIATDMKISQETNTLLEKVFIPQDIYIQEVKRYVDAGLKK